MSDEKYCKDMEAAIISELHNLLIKQTIAFQEAAEPHFDNDDEPSWLKAWDASGYKLHQMVYKARVEVLDTLKLKYNYMVDKNG